MTQAVKTTRDTREQDSRKKSWRPPQRLGVPTPPAGYRYRWVRHELRGEDHAANVYGRTRQGYEPVRPEELGDNFDAETISEGKHQGVVRSGDLILMKVPEDVVEARTEYFDGQASKMDEAVNSDLKRHSSPKMPISNESESSVSIGTRKKLPNPIQD